MSTRILFVDDSGKPDPAHASRAVVIGGLAIDSELYPHFSERLLILKRRFYAARGAPERWELKSAAIKPNPWKRSKNRHFCGELARLLRVSGATAFTVTIAKARMHHPMTLATTMPLQLQALVEHFDVECKALGKTGIVVADWSSQHHDQHASSCVASFVRSRRLALHPGVYYASSHGNEAVQAADLIAGVRRRVEEGDLTLSRLDAKFAAVRACPSQGLMVKGRPFNNWVALF